MQSHFKSSILHYDDRYRERERFVFVFVQSAIISQVPHALSPGLHDRRFKALQNQRACIDAHGREAGRQKHLTSTLTR